MIGFGQARERAERLLTLSCVLQLGRPLTLAELRDRFDLYIDGTGQSTRKQFERDKADLRALGIDVETLRVRGDDAYRISTRPPAIAIDWTDEEALALAALAAAVADDVTGGALAKASHHTGDFPAEDRRARIRVQLHASPALTDAHARRRRVTFEYRNARGEVGTRTVEPWALASRRGQAYVTGFDLERGEGRAFRIDRILGEVADVGRAEHLRPDGIGVPLAPEERSTVRLALPQRLLPDALAMGAEVVDDDGDRAVVVLADVRDETAIGWALRHEAEVLAPVAIANEVTARRRRIGEVHRGEPSLPPLDDRGPVTRPRRAGLTDQRLTRLLALPEWLAARAGVTVEEVATAFGCSVEEVEAELGLIGWLDIPRLGLVGEVVDHADGQLEFLPMLNAPRAELTSVEAVHLLSLVEVARALLPSTSTPALQSVARRLREVLPGGAAPIAQDDLAHPLLERLQDVVGTSVEVRFTYHGRRDARARPRRCRPEQLQLTGGALYLVGHDPDRDGVRVFRLDRMSHLAVHQADEGADGSATVEPDYVPVDDEVEVELLLSPRAVWILALMDPSATLDLDEGWVHAVVPTDVPDWLLAHVRAAGGEAELLRPARLREELAG